jgi:cbb3-type cytochrome oxidase maturation protein
MEFLYITIPITIALAILGLIGFIWQAKSGGMDDPEGPKYRMLYDDEEENSSFTRKEIKGQKDE